jgi:hypothetical protein
MSVTRGLLNPNTGNKPVEDQMANNYKWHPGKSELSLEDQFDKFLPKSADKKKQTKDYIKSRIVSLSRRWTDLPREKREKIKTNLKSVKNVDEVSDTDGAEYWNEKRAASQDAWAYLGAQLKLHDLEGAIDHAFMKSFWNWLMGAGTKKETLNTPWGRTIPSWDQGVKSYIENLLGAYASYRMEIYELMLKGRTMQLKGMDDFFKYYKYIVCGDPSRVPDDFLDDVMDVMLNAQRLKQEALHSPLESFAEKFEEIKPDIEGTIEKPSKAKLAAESHYLLADDDADAEYPPESHGDEFVKRDLAVMLLSDRFIADPTHLKATDDEEKVKYSIDEDVVWLIGKKRYQFKEASTGEKAIGKIEFYEDSIVSAEEELIRKGAFNGDGTPASDGALTHRSSDSDESPGEGEIAPLTEVSVEVAKPEEKAQEDTNTLDVTTGRPMIEESASVVNDSQLAHELSAITASNIPESSMSVEEENKAQEIIDKATPKQEIKPKSILTSTPGKGLLGKRVAFIGDDPDFNGYTFSPIKATNVSANIVSMESDESKSASEVPGSPDSADYASPIAPGSPSHDDSLNSTKSVDYSVDESEGSHAILTAYREAASAQLELSNAINEIEKGIQHDFSTLRRAGKSPEEVKAEMRNIIDYAERKGSEIMKIVDELFKNMANAATKRVAVSTISNIGHLAEFEGLPIAITPENTTPAESRIAAYMTDSYMDMISDESFSFFSMDSRDNCYSWKNFIFSAAEAKARNPKAFDHIGVIDTSAWMKLFQERGITPATKIGEFTPNTLKKFQALMTKQIVHFSDVYIKNNGQEKWNLRNLMMYAHKVQLKATYATLVTSNDAKIRIGGKPMPAWFGPLYAADNYFKLLLVKTWISRDVNYLYRSYNY